MVEAEFVCPCGFKFKERFLETEITLAVDLENFYVRCPRCGEEATPRSLQPASEKQPRRRDWS
jgi:phage terminase large subunit GpA-like protein